MLVGIVLVQDHSIRVSDGSGEFEPLEAENLKQSWGHNGRRRLKSAASGFDIFLSGQA